MTAENLRHLHPVPDRPDGPLRILRAIPPAPAYAPGTYEVRLELSRRLTVYEDEALHRRLHGLHVVGRELTVYDTTLEKVAAEAPHLAAVMHEVEDEGRRLSEETARRSAAYDASVRDRAARLADLADSIDFPA